ncbi:MAG: tRNA pseudouridine(38-40) synthase TruA [Puniceicoccales bacterium]|jgi:tRNA pseudouridine38-40 synthase|nr:tRNA pseudouridine(38-40) synthase TruA [Puniceicoccales bacterium]
MKFQRWCGICSYDGTDFGGWQSQPNGNTIQDALEGRLGQIFQRPTKVIGSGRTDAGVHANGQCFHFDSMGWSHGGDALLRALHCGLPESIHVETLVPVRPNFHARFSALGKRYLYFFQKGYAVTFRRRFCWSLGNFSVDGKSMEAAASLFMGTHNFRAFANLRSDGSDGDFVRTITRSELLCHGDSFVFITEGNGYLYRMVRRIVGALVAVGQGKIGASDVRERLENPRGNFPAQTPTAPARGLFLDRIFF